MPIPGLVHGSRGVEVEELHGWKAAVVKIGEVIYVLDEYGKTAGTRPDLNLAFQRASELLTDGREWPEPMLLRGDCSARDTLSLPSWVELQLEGRVRVPEGFDKPLFKADSATGVYLKGSGVVEAGALSQPLFYARLCEDVSLRGLKFKAEWSPGDPAVHPVVFEACESFEVVGCRFSGGYAAIEVKAKETEPKAYSRDFVIAFNRMHGPDVEAGYAVLIRQDSSVFTVGRNVVKGYCQAIHVRESGKYGTITGNVCRDLHGGGIVVLGSEVAVVGNYVRNPGTGASYTLEDLNRGIIVGNVCYGGSYEGIIISKFRHGVVANNLIVEPGWEGIRIWASNHLVVEGNVIKNPSRSGDGVYAGISFVGYEGAPEAAHNIVRDNMIVCDDPNVRPRFAVMEAVPTEQFGPLDPAPYPSSNPDWNVIEGNRFIGYFAEGLVHRAGEHTVVRNNIDYATESSGTATFSGDGSKTQFAIPHGLVKAPNRVSVTPLTPDAAGDHYVTWDDQNIYVNYLTAPPSGTDNVKLAWMAEV